MRIVLDTNILVRAVSGRSMNSKVFDYLFNQEYTLCISTEILLEYEEILSRIYDKEIAELVISSILLLPNVIRTEVYYDMRLITSDADDDKFANCAFAANAHFIVSDDKHFSILKKIDFPKISVVSYDIFLQML
jgi:putative PIN family toxin of toxin-antitoxin system